MSTDTRHPHYDDATLQAAIDAALMNLRPIFIACVRGSLPWDRQAPARLALARGLLARLPEPQPPTADGKTPGEVYQEILHKLDPDRFYSWSEIRPTLQQEIEQGASAVLAAFGGTGLEAAIARMEAVPWKELDAAWDKNVVGVNGDAKTLQACFEDVRARLIAAAREGQPASQPAEIPGIEWPGGECPLKDEAGLVLSESAFANYRGLIISALNEAGAPTHHPDIGAPALKPMMPQERIKALCGLSTLRPIGEAGEVPAGAVRYYFYFSQGEWLTDYCKSCDVTHFADILLPPEAKATAVEAAKPAYVGHMTDEMPTKPEPSPQPSPPPWQPAVGDVVRLKSGGPAMTASELRPDGWACDWFNQDDCRDAGIFPAACLKPVAKEAQP